MPWVRVGAGGYNDLWGGLTATLSGPVAIELFDDLQRGKRRTRSPMYVPALRNGGLAAMGLSGCFHKIQKFVARSSGGE